MNEVEFVFPERPFLFGIVDLELEIHRDPAKLGLIDDSNKALPPTILAVWD